MVDIMTLMWSHISIEKKELRKIQVKTANGRHPRHTIPLNDAAIAILHKWKERARREKFVFDLVQDSFNIDDTENLYYVRNSCDRKVNQSLHIVGDRIGLDFNLSFHTARHTFASTVTLANNVSWIVVSKMLGHSNVRMTEHYAKLVDTCIGEEMDKLMNTYSAE